MRDSPLATQMTPRFSFRMTGVIIMIPMRMMAHPILCNNYYCCCLSCSVQHNTTAERPGNRILRLCLSLFPLKQLDSKSTHNDALSLSLSSTSSDALHPGSQTDTQSPPFHTHTHTQTDTRKPGMRSSPFPRLVVINESSPGLVVPADSPEDKNQRLDLILFFPVNRYPSV